jgi:DNA repair protein RadD
VIAASGMQPRDYQLRAVESLRGLIRQGHRRLVLVSPTGSGKTFMSSMMVQSAVEKGKSVLFLAHRRELVVQKSKTLLKFDVPHGIIQSGMENDTGYSVQVASKDTLHARAMRRERMHLPPADLIIADECHRSLAKTWQAIFNAYPEAVLIGLTATPVRGTGVGLGSTYDQMVIAATSPELIASGALVPTTIYAPHKPDLRGVKVARGDYVQSLLEKKMNQQTLVGDVLKHWERLADGRKSVGFACGVQHSLHLRDTFLARGIKAAHIDGNTPDSQRDDILAELSAGRLTVVFNAMVLTEGWDQPDVSVAMLVRPTKSFGLYLQMAGRIQRPFPGKESALLIDHAGAVHQHGFPDEEVPWSLDDKSKVEDRIAQKKSKEPTEQRQITCEKCSAVFAGRPSCPRCGHLIERKAKEVAQEKGELAEVVRDKLNRMHSIADKQKWWDTCLGWAVGNGMKVGAAAHRYKQQYGVFPNHKLQNVPRSSQWQMKAKQFYHDVVKPAKDLAKREASEAVR